MKREILMQGDDLLTLIPQRPPIVMVDRFYGIEKSDSFTGLKILEDNIFVSDSYLSESGLIEHLAQSAAVRAGYQFYMENKNVPLGFIASVDKLHIYKLPVIGDILYTKIRNIQQVGSISLIDARSSSNGTLLIEGKMKIYLDLK